MQYFQPINSKADQKKLDDHIGDQNAHGLAAIRQAIANIQLTPGQSGFSGYSGFSGFSGAQGASGYSGFSGYSGYSGATGAAGTSGVSGFSGYSGATGQNGQTGVSGFSGYSGASGSSGTTGQSGASGFSGTSGYSGFSGQTGATGPAGSTGASGFSGYSGTTGGVGPAGAGGASGISGYSGFSGYSGVGGPMGQRGLPGTPGLDGFNGQSGFSGYSGFSGASGFSGQAGSPATNLIQSVNSKTGAVTLLGSDIEISPVNNSPLSEIADIAYALNYSVPTHIADNDAHGLVTIRADLLNAVLSIGDVQGQVDAETANRTTADDGLTAAVAGKASASTVSSHIANTSNPHSVTKAQVALSNVPNVDATNASNISTGTLNAARLPSLSYLSLSGGTLTGGLTGTTAAFSGIVQSAVNGTQAQYFSASNGYARFGEGSIGFCLGSPNANSLGNPYAATFFTYGIQLASGNYTVNPASRSIVFKVDTTGNLTTEGSVTVGADINLPGGGALVGGYGPNGQTGVFIRTNEDQEVLSLFMKDGEQVIIDENGVAFQVPVSTGNVMVNGGLTMAGTIISLNGDGGGSANQVMYDVDYGGARITGENVVRLGTYNNETAVIVGDGGLSVNGSTSTNTLAVYTEASFDGSAYFYGNLKLPYYGIDSMYSSAEDGTVGYSYITADGQATETANVVVAFAGQWFILNKTPVTFNYEGGGGPIYESGGGEQEQGGQGEQEQGQ